MNHRNPLEQQFLNKTFDILTSVGMSDIRSASFHQDVEESTDILATWNGKEVAIGNRTRRGDYLNIRTGRFYRDLLFRAETTNGSPTELDKIAAGCSDYYIFSWVWGDKICRWVLIDMKQFRKGLIEYPDTEGRSDRKFYGWNIQSLRDAGCVVAEYPSSMEDLKEACNLFPECAYIE